MLDTIPGRRQAAILLRVRDGDRIASPNGRGLQFERGLGTARAVMETLLNALRGLCPDGPVFGGIGDGRITTRHELALEAWEGH